MSDPYRFRRNQMVQLLEQRGIRDPRVLEAVRQVPRHAFVPETMRSRAYGDHALPIGKGQTISQPYIVARMTELLAPEPEHSVLEIGSGSGYQTAILAKLVRRVYSLERVGELAKAAIARMRELSLDNVKIQVFDGTVGWSEVAPFDRILVTAGAPGAPPPLIDQLKTGGLMLIPEGNLELQRLVVYEKTPEGVRRSEGEGVVFVPLIGRHGWDREKTHGSDS